MDVVDPEHEHLHEHPDPTGWKIPLTSKCKSERAFRAGVLTFSPPTPKRLARALNEVATGGLTVVIQRRGEDFQVTLSGTESHGGREAFLPETTPPFVRLVDGAGEPPGLSSERFQPFGILRLTGNDKNKITRLELRSLNWYASESERCDTLQVHVYANLPPAQWSVELPLRSGAVAVRKLLDPELLLPPQGDPEMASPLTPTHPLPVPLHFSFQATLVPFVP